MYINGTLDTVLSGQNVTPRIPPTDLHIGDEIVAGTAPEVLMVLFNVHWVWNRELNQTEGVS